MGEVKILPLQGQNKPPRGRRGKSSASAASAALPAYAELVATTNFSFLRGGSHAEELVAMAKALGLRAIAVADRNTLAGVARAHLAARETGMRLIVGARLDLQDAPSLVCLPRDRKAYGRLSALLTLGQRRAGKGECLLWLADVVAHAEGQVFIALPPENWSFRFSAAAAIPVPPIGHLARRQAISSTISNAIPESVISFPSPARIGIGEAPAHDGCDVTEMEKKLCPQIPYPQGQCENKFEQDLLRLKSAFPEAPWLAASLLYRGDDQARIEALASLAGRTGLKLVASNDVLYHTSARRLLQDVLTCIREKCTLSDAGYRLAANAERHLKSAAEMARLFKGYEHALAATCEIADACRFSLDELVYEYPDEPVPHGKTAQQHLCDLVSEGLCWRYPDGPPGHVAQNVEKELGLIEQLGYAHYFLTVHDIVTFARSRDIYCQGRGSAANSAVCYCLGITNVNPAEIDLLFERFVTPERKEPPDIDVDFEHERREEVIQYIYARYGRDHAGLAASVTSYRGRSAVRDVGKALGLSEDTLSVLAGTVWGVRSDGLRKDHIREAGIEPDNPLIARVLELADELVGFPRHLSQHVGGFVLTRGPLSEVVPIGNAAMPDRTVIEWDKDDLDALGLLKVDVLGLGMLSCIHRAFDLIMLHEGKRLTLANVPREDPAVYDMLCAADSIGVFQVESRAQMNMLPRLKPRCFYDLVIEVAIVRPGPIQGDMVHPYLRRRDGLEPEEYPAPAAHEGPPDELRRILGKTRGVPLFQEQAMRIAMVAAKFSGEEVNQLRRAMATFRRRGTIHELEEKMISRMVARGYDIDFAARCFNQIKGFGDYGFPESHAASFAHLVYISSWLKCHRPAAFAAALLNSQPMGFYAPAQIVRDAREHGVELRPVDVNLSDWDCTLEPLGKHRKSAGGRKGDRKGDRSAGQKAVPGGRGGFALRLGLRQIDGLRRDEADKIVAARMLAPAVGRAGTGEAVRTGEAARIARVAGTDHAACDMLSGSPSAGFPFESIAELRRRAGVRLATLERLAAADAFRSLGLDRRQALWEIRAMPAPISLPLFNWADAEDTGPEAAVMLPEMPLSEHVVNDYQTLRLSLKAHPMSFLRARLDSEGILPAGGLRGSRDGARVCVAGVVLVRQRPGSAKGVVFMTIEDETGVANAIVWPKVLERDRKIVMGARLILVRGRIQRHENIIHLIAERLEDRSHWLSLLSEGVAINGDEETSGGGKVQENGESGRGAGLRNGFRCPLAHADEVARPGPDPYAHPHEQVSGVAAAGAGAGWTPGRHPRSERVVPKSRDFH